MVNIYPPENSPEMCWLSLVGLVTLAVLQVASVPSASTVGSDLTFLFQNDLNWHTAPDHDGTILISKAGTNTQALASCKQLNEGLLPTNGTFFRSDIDSLLAYINLQTKTPEQRFWVTSASSSKCSAISLHGGIQTVNCRTVLPALCSQSAPYRPNTATDMNPQFQVEVKSKKLTVLGTRDHLSFRFIGIPYADPFERFTYSRKFSGSGSVNALAYGSRCTQSGAGSEDCLFLNIYTPFLPQNAAKSKGLKPVLFWIHGGGFTGGEGSDGIFDGGNMASRSDVVVVTINYRLGTLGFLALDDGVTNGNFGIADQVTALQWVQDHIADFGGDPTRVTIYGQSAGAGSVRALLATKPAFGLFKGAIAQSNLGGFGYASTYSAYMTIQQEVASFGAPLVASVGCANNTNVLACLRVLPAATLINAPNAPRYIVVDGKFITTNQLEVDGSGPAAPAHVIFGWMRDDGSDFIGSFPSAGTTTSQSLVASGLNSTIASLAAASPLFPLPNGANQTMNIYNQTSRIGTDGQFRCVDQATLIAAAKHKVFPSIYAYQFDRSYGGFEPIPGTCDPAATAEFPNGDPKLPYFRCHSGELFYMFGTLGQSTAPFRDWDDLVLSQVGVDTWASFARTFNPNPSPEFLAARGYTNTTQILRQAGLWPQVTPGNKTPLRIIDAPFSNSAWLEQAQCDLLGFPSTMFG
ncbi:Alpha/Beta hydrolase protein [Crucibulum laeve]|uniref:Carboxylic ester hydrolase n=1 Tax=Crucibulum laeve TaxID=68775 RepID=A0A5C3LI62_9AGAR|nr:Alpha/Beta hydrolase protein [Crucibulum laeve]